MKILIKILLFAFCAYSISSCKEDELMLYSSSPEIYFIDNVTYYRNIADLSHKDSMNVFFSYYGESTIEYLVSTDVRVTGVAVDYDRYATIGVVDAASTAVAGEHYKDLTTSVLIPAGAYTGTVKVTALRSADLLDKTVTLNLRLIENEYFKTNMTELVTSTSTGKKISPINYRVKITDVLARPLRWMDGNFGTFTRKKCLLICEINGFPSSFLDGQPWNGATILPGDITFYAKYTQLYLNQQAAAGTPVYEADGVTLMAMGASIII